VVVFFYKRYVESPMNGLKNWEARLQSHLQERMDASTQENWSHEMGMLDGQRINPFELGHNQSDNLVRARKLELGITL